ncbi:MAG TPA: metallophosphoesterase [Candidatus Angelobacter sp.]|nr:metallophosphoesterase [Candidatus Angelobacter sp.]
MLDRWVRWIRILWFAVVFAMISLSVPQWVGSQEALTALEKNGEKHSKEKAPQTKETDRVFVLVGAGDIASCKNLAGAQATAKLIEQIPGTVFAAGDLAYDSGSPDEFEFCYGPTWGRFKDRTKPAMGNHEYVNPTAHGYFDYWGAQAGPRGKGYYSYDLGAWHIVVLNTNCYVKALGGCGAGSPEETWLKADLAQHANACIVAYGHHALFSSGIFKKHAVHPELKPLWDDLYAAHADLVLAGHEHSYERFAPQDPQGKADPDHGIREIVVGTGGKSHDLLGFATPNSEVRDWDTYGVLRLTLAPGKYTWEFVPEEGKSFRDSGSGSCHNQASTTN